MTGPPPDSRENAEAWNALVEMTKSFDDALCRKWEDKLRNLVWFTTRFAAIALTPLTIM
ncbi:hypothetical protein BJ165DRAFT_1426505, partial [Panaeolus papilionaceus]